jgi:Holliday junction resolvase-like predicted endonuclease
MRTLWHRGEEPQVFFWRTSIGAEVDLIVDTGKELVPVEVKQTARRNQLLAKGIETFRADMQARAGKGYLIIRRGKAAV